jgi:hypothetical protein
LAAQAGLDVGYGLGGAGEQDAVGAQLARGLDVGLHVIGEFQDAADAETTAWNVIARSFSLPNQDGICPRGKVKRAAFAR